MTITNNDTMDMNTIIALSGAGLVFSPDVGA